MALNKPQIQQNAPIVLPECDMMVTAMQLTTIPGAACACRINGTDMDDDGVGDYGVCLQRQPG